MVPTFLGWTVAGMRPVSSVRRLVCINFPCVLDLTVAGISLMIGLGLFAVVASILCATAFFQNAKEIA